MNKRFLIVLFFPVFLLSCNKDIVDVDPNYIGNWIGPDVTDTYYLEIYEDSKAKFIIEDDSGSREVKKGVLRIDKDKLIMKSVFVYEVIESPLKLDSTITFMLHDYEYPVTMRMKLKSPKSWGGGEVYYYK